MQESAGPPRNGVNETPIAQWADKKSEAKK